VAPNLAPGAGASSLGLYRTTCIRPSRGLTALVISHSCNSSTGSLNLTASALVSFTPRLVASTKTLRNWVAHVAHGTSESLNSTMTTARSMGGYPRCPRGRARQSRSVSSAPVSSAPSPLLRHDRKRSRYRRSHEDRNHHHNNPGDSKPTHCLLRLLPSAFPASQTPAAPAEERTPVLPGRQPSRNFSHCPTPQMPTGLRRSMPGFRWRRGHTQAVWLSAYDLDALVG
jgi:hypothetical protein